jgi:uncharacterized hydrophobic protein (TIGR00271 family)
VAGVLTAIAFLTNSIPILIGAMVIAPALPPLALAIFSFAGGQPKLAIRAIVTILLGVVVAVAGAVIVTWVLQIAQAGAEVQSGVYRPLFEERVRPGWYSAIVAFAAGAAGVIGIAKRRTDVLIGTVASVALVPAACAAGISLADGDLARAGGATLLLVINLLLLPAAGLLTIALVPVERID